MKFHIVQVGENKEKIARLYNVDVDDISKLNPTINNRELIVGEKIKIGDGSNIVDDISEIYIKNQKEVIEEDKYICPHCKNIILIPKK
jgi:LysM repeat protein